MGQMPHRKTEQKKSGRVACVHIGIARSAARAIKLSGRQVAIIGQHAFCSIKLHRELPDISHEQVARFVQN
jgi:hypothetical protein